MIYVNKFGDYIRESKEFSRTVYRGITDGSPKVIYGSEYSDHGIGTFWTNNILMAKWFAGISEYDMEVGDYVDDPTPKGKVIEETISIKNPYIIDDTHPNHNLAMENDSFTIYMDEIKEAKGVVNYKKGLIEKGYDGIVLKDNTTNYYSYGTYDIYITF